MESRGYETLDLLQAADFLKLHWQTLRAKAKRGEVPAAKLGRRWVFLQEDLVSYLRSNYSTSRPRSQVQHIGDSLCCTNDQTRPTGGANLPHPTADEYDSLLKR
jgi:excisionase family DNA binding protein